MEERLRKPVLILQAERALIEIAVFRDTISGDAQDIVEASWRGINTIRQALIDSLTPDEELALEQQRREVHLRTQKQRRPGQQAPLAILSGLDPGDRPILN